MRSFPLFGEIDLLFFRPLTGRFAPLYWAVLEHLYELDFEGEPFEITQELAIEQVALLLERSQEFNAPESTLEAGILGEEWNTGAAPGTQAVELAEAAEDERRARRLARIVLKRLEKVGWFDYEYRQAQKGYVLNFRDYAARILHTLTQVARQEQPVFEGFAQSIKAALAPEEIQEKPGVALYNAQKATKDLVREVKILSRNIHRYSDRVLKERHTTQQLLELQLDIYQSKVVDSSYHRFKTSDNVFRYRGFILQQLGVIDSDPLIQASAIQWISKNQAIDYDAANLCFEEWIAVIRNQLTSIHLLTDDLDRKNARYTAATLQKLSYLLSQDHLIENRLIHLIRQVTEMPDSKAWAFSPAFACFQVVHFDSNSLYVPPKERVPMDLVEVPVAAISADQKRAVAKTTRDALARQYSRERVYALASEILKGKSSISIRDLPLASARDLTRLVYLSCYGRDARAPFQFITDPEGARLRVGSFDVPDAELRKVQIQ